MGAAELICQLRSGKNQRESKGDVMKHSNAVGWSDFVNHLAGSDRQEMHGHRGARRKHCVQTLLFGRKSPMRRCSSQLPARPEKFASSRQHSLWPLSDQAARNGRVIQLLHDSFSQPFTVGIRSAPRASDSCSTVLSRTRLIFRLNCTRR